MGMEPLKHEQAVDNVIRPMLWEFTLARRLLDFTTPFSFLSWVNLTAFGFTSRVSCQGPAQYEVSDMLMASVRGIKVIQGRQLAVYGLGLVIVT